MKTPAQVLEDLDNIKKNYIIFYATEDKGKIIGCVGLEIYRGTPRLKRMYILKSYRNKEIGKRLFDKIVKYCKNKNYKKIVLSTTPQMKEAINFLRRLMILYIKIL